MNIKIDHLNFSYNKKEDVLHDINLEIKQGTINVLLGLNGSGKTTLIKSLAGLFNASLNSIYYGEQSLKEMSISYRSKMIAYVSQKTNSIGDVLIKDYLTFGMVNSLSFYQSPKKEHLLKVEEVAKQFNITHLLDKKLEQVSGGERQIIAIASAIIQDSEVILLDEPTSALDLANQNLILSTLKHIAETKNKTIILSSHNPNHALFLDCNVALMDKGRLIKYGKASEIITVESLKDIYGENICLSNDLPYKEISFKAN